MCYQEQIAWPELVCLKLGDYRIFHTNRTTTSNGFYIWTNATVLTKLIKITNFLNIIATSNIHTWQPSILVPIWNWLCFPISNLGPRVWNSMKQEQWKQLDIHPSGQIILHLSSIMHLFPMTIGPPIALICTLGWTTTKLPIVTSPSIMQSLETLLMGGMVIFFWGFFSIVVSQSGIRKNKMCKEYWLLSWFGFQNTFSLENSSIISRSIFTLKRQAIVFFIYLSILLLKYLSKTKRKTKNYQITHQMITKSVFQCLNSPQQERIVRKNVLTNWHEPNKRCVDLQHWFEHQQQICRWTRTRPSWEGTGRHNFRCRPDRHHWSPSNTHLPW